MAMPIRFTKSNNTITEEKSFGEPEWITYDRIILVERDPLEWVKDNLYRGTIRKPKAVGRNDPCPCGSGRKFKRCCRKGA